MIKRGFIGVFFFLFLIAVLEEFKPELIRHEIEIALKPLTSHLRKDLPLPSSADSREVADNNQPMPAETHLDVSHDDHPVRSGLMATIIVDRGCIIQRLKKGKTGAVDGMLPNSFDFQNTHPTNERVAFDASFPPELKPHALKQILRADSCVSDYVVHKF